jgi:hypothetical protein
MLLDYVTSAFVFGLCNTGLALSGKLQRAPIFQVPAGSLFWPFRYYWRIVTLIAVWCTYVQATRLLGVLPIVCAFGYEVYLIATMDRQVLTP